MYAPQILGGEVGRIMYRKEGAIERREWSGKRQEGSAHRFLTLAHLIDEFEVAIVWIPTEDGAVLVHTSETVEQAANDAASLWMTIERLFQLVAHELVPRIT